MLKKAIPNHLAQSQRLPVMESVSVGMDVPKQKFQNFSKAEAARASVLWCFLGVQWTQVGLHRVTGITYDILNVVTGLITII